MLRRLVIFELKFNHTVVFLGAELGACTEQDMLVFESAYGPGAGLCDDEERDLVADELSQNRIESIIRIVHSIFLMRSTKQIAVLEHWLQMIRVFDKLFEVFVHP